MQRLARVGVTFLTLDRLFLTHFHPDHCLDLASILFAMRLPSPARTRPFTVYGPRGLRRLYRGLNETLGGWLAPRTYRLTLQELRPGATIRGRGWTARTAAMDHSTPCLGYRIRSGGKVFAYSGDTDVGAGIVRLGADADTLILECSMTDERKVSGHLTPSECGRLAAAARCRRLVLTHFYPVFRGYDVRARVRRAFRGPVILARDFTRLTL